MAVLHSVVRAASVARGLQKLDVCNGGDGGTEAVEASVETVWLLDAMLHLVL